MPIFEEVLREGWTKPEFHHLCEGAKANRLFWQVDLVDDTPALIRFGHGVEISFCPFCGSNLREATNEPRPSTG
jgi:hypothetical protein